MTSKIVNGGARRKYRTYGRRRRGGVLSPQEWAASHPGEPIPPILSHPTIRRRVGNLYGRQRVNIYNPPTSIKPNVTTVAASASMPSLNTQASSRRISFPPRTARNTQRANRKSRRNRRSRRH